MCFATPITTFQYLKVALLDVQSQKSKTLAFQTQIRKSVTAANVATGSKPPIFGRFLGHLVGSLLIIGPARRALFHFPKTIFTNLTLYPYKICVLHQTYFHSVACSCTAFTAALESRFAFPASTPGYDLHSCPLFVVAIC